MTSPGGRGGTDSPAALLIVSREPFLLSEAEEEWSERLIRPENRDLNRRVLYGWETRVGEVVEFLQTLPFLGDRRLLILREVQKLEDWRYLVDYLKDPNPASCLLMTSSETGRSDAPFRVLSPYSESREIKRPHGKALVSWVARRFKKHGKTAEPGLCEVLVQITGGNMALLATEIEKVSLGAGDRGKIEPDDLDVSVPGGVEVIFNLLDALGDGDGSKALMSLKTLLDNGNAPEYIVHMMAWHFRQLLKGKELVLSGLSPQDAAHRMGKKHYGLKEKFARQLGRAADRDLAGTMESLAHCDRDLKTGRIPPEILLDRLVLELLA